MTSILAKKANITQRMGTWADAMAFDAKAKNIPVVKIRAGAPAAPSTAIIKAAIVTWIKIPVAAIDNL